MKTYYNLQTEERTTKSSIALAWHRKGKDVFVEQPTKVTLINGAAQPKKKNDNLERCKDIAETVEKYASGRAYRCPMCEEIVTVPSDWSGEKYRCPHCKNTLEEYDFEPLTVWDYFDDCLDIEYRINSNKEFRSVKVMIAFGGPNIYIDTDTRQVELYWWGDRASYHIDNHTCDEINNFFQEMYEC